MKSEEKVRSPKFLRRRKLLMVAPVLILPFAILLMWTLHLVGDTKATDKNSALASGINLNLPAAATPKDSNWNKLRYYEQAEKDSVKLKSKLKSSASLFGLPDEESESMEGVSEAELAERMYGSDEAAPIGTRVKTGNKWVNADKNERMVYDRLSKLQRELSREPEPKRDAAPASPPAYNPETEQIKAMMQQMQSPAAEDPELGKLDGMLDKIIAIQNPQKVQDDLEEKLEKKKGLVYAVTRGPDNLNPSLLEGAVETNEVQDNNGFYSADNSISQKSGQNTVRAVVHETQVLVNGATVKLRLVDDVRINGIPIPRETFIHGEASLSGERLRIVISSIRYGSQLFPVQLVVYDMDGLAGVRVPGAISKQVIQQSADRGLQGLGFNTVSSSVGLQAASLGVEAAKSFLSRKVKQVRVTVKAGYQVLLKDGKQKE